MCNQAVRLMLDIASKYNMAGQENSWLVGWAGHQALPVYVELILGAANLHQLACLLGAADRSLDLMF